MQLQSESLYLFYFRETHCGVLLQLSPTVSTCKLRQAGLSALQQAPDQQTQATILREVETVGMQSPSWLTLIISTVTLESLKEMADCVKLLPLNV